MHQQWTLNGIAFFITTFQLVQKTTLLIEFIENANCISHYAGGFMSEQLAKVLIRVGLYYQPIYMTNKQEAKLSLGQPTVLPHSRLMFDRMPKIVGVT